MAFETKMESKFDPNAAASKDSGIFGLPFSEDQSKLVLFGVPWDVTTSYRPGTSKGPQAIFEASKQVDIYDLELGRPYEAGIFMRPLSSSRHLVARNRLLRRKAEPILEVGGVLDPKKKNTRLHKLLKEVNDGGNWLNQWVHQQTLSILEKEKIPGLVGGDHSTPFGAFLAAARVRGRFGILHFDAHSDTRRAFEGFRWSHASIMYNALTEIPEITNLVQVGIRDFCEEEMNFIESQEGRVRTFFDHELKRGLRTGTLWSQWEEKIIASLPEQVWISFDVDGLDPRFCPHTGTPVPGGLEFDQALGVMAAVAKSGRRILGFDLNEVAPHPRDQSDEWDANVGARLLYKMCGYTLASVGAGRFR